MVRRKGYRKKVIMKVKRQITKQTATEKSPDEADTLSQKKKNNNNNNITVSLVWEEERAGGGEET